MSYHNPSRNYYERQPYRVPGYLPFAQPLRPGDIAVPNEAFGFWPQGQFAPEFFPAGHKSFQDFRYPNFQAAEVVWNGVEFAEADDVPYGEALGSEWAEEWRPVGLFLSGLLIGYLYFSPNSPMKG